jgi:transcriptional regulator with XRE-family HTH domain
MMEQPELGKKIVELRKIKGLTQEDLIEKCNLSVRTLQRIESGEVKPRSYTIKLIFSALDFNINDELTTNTSNKFSEAIFRASNKLEQFFKSGIIHLKSKTNSMQNPMTFFQRFFLATGIVWFLCGISILIFKLNFGSREIVITLILPLAYAILRIFDKGKPSKSE